MLLLRFFTCEGHHGDVGGADDKAVGEGAKHGKDEVNDHVWRAAEGHGTWRRLPPSDGIAAAGQ